MYFRTFGSDLPQVKVEWNRLCERVGATDKQLSDEQCGVFERSKRGDSSLRLGQREHSGLHAIYEVFRRGTETLALQECYGFWRDNDKHRHAGKLLLVDEQDRAHRHVFFDDNAYDRDDDTDIVDLRLWHRDCFRCAEQNEGRKTGYVVEADPFLVIQDNNFFIDHVRTILND